MAPDVQQARRGVLVRQAGGFPDEAVVESGTRVGGKAELARDPEPILARPGELATAGFDQAAAGACSGRPVDQALAGGGLAVGEKAVHGLASAVKPKFTMV
jgi:hypothetical protein